jgi:hypothetical protein
MNKFMNRRNVNKDEDTRIIRVGSAVDDAGKRDSVRKGLPNAQDLSRYGPLSFIPNFLHEQGRKFTKF